MTAYNPGDLYNKFLREQALEAFLKKSIGEESYKKIAEAHPQNLYTPNYFIRIALGVLTIIAVLFISILLGLLFETSGNPQLVILCIFLGVACYVILELMVKRKKYYNAGMDNILMLCFIIFFVSAFFVYDFTPGYLLISGVVMMLCFYLCIRFTDAFMACISYLAFFLFSFLLFLKLGPVAKMMAPLFVMTVSAIVYIVMKKTEEKNSLIVYQFSIRSVKILTLLTFYAAANYFVVRELSNAMFDLQLTIHDTIPMGWLFWALTIMIPIIYILYGIKRKDFIFIRTGLALVAAAVFTVRYYHTLFPLEIAMLIAGLVIIAISYSLMKYLKSPKYGFTFEDLYPANKNLINAEALIIAQTFGKSDTPETSNLYGGGSGGGGGATGEF